MSEYYPNRLRYWAEAIATGTTPPATKIPDVMRGMADAWDADKTALQAMTEEANAEGVRAAKAEAEVRELRALIKAHNERVAAACKWRQENGHCDYAKRGDLCPDCPQEWEIGND